MNKFRSIRFNLDEELLSELDGHRHRFLTRSEMLQLAVSRFLADVRADRVRLKSSSGWTV